MSPLTGLALSTQDTQSIVYIVAGILVLAVFLVVARVAAHLIAQQLHQREVRADMVVLGRRVVYVLVIGLGIMGAFGLAFQTANVTLVGILIATVVAALGVQDLLKDYVSGYYILLEHHVRVGDRIGVAEKVGIVTEVKLRVTLLHSDSGDLVVVPNSELFTKPVTIFARQTAAATEPAPTLSEPR